jgi:hypothetical protein
MAVTVLIVIMFGCCLVLLFIRCCLCGAIFVVLLMVLMSLGFLALLLFFTLVDSSTKCNFD